MEANEKYALTEPLLYTNQVKADIMFFSSLNSAGKWFLLAPLEKQASVSLELAWRPHSQSWGRFQGCLDRRGCCQGLHRRGGLKGSCSCPQRMNRVGGGAARGEQKEVAVGGGGFEVPKAE